VLLSFLLLLSSSLFLLLLVWSLLLLVAFPDQAIMNSELHHRRHKPLCARQAGPVVASAVALALRHGRFDELAMHPTVKPVALLQQGQVNRAVLARCLS
jgi:hypothetical protein